MKKGDDASPCIILAGRALLVKMLITLEPHGIFGSNFVYLCILTKNGCYFLPFSLLLLFYIFSFFFIFHLFIYFYFCFFFHFISFWGSFFFWNTYVV